MPASSCAPCHGALTGLLSAYLESEFQLPAVQDVHQIFAVHMFLVALGKKNTFTEALRVFFKFHLRAFPLPLFVLVDFHALRTHTS